MELNTLSKITCYSRKLSLKNFINKNNKVTLIFSKKDYNRKKAGGAFCWERWKPYPLWSELGNASVESANNEIVTFLRG